jgi:RNA polymerase sigma-70 factor (ECF subfamily)
VSSAQIRDEELIRALYARHAPSLLAFVQRLVNGDRAAAEDIVQETLLRAWRHSDELTVDSVRPWLFTTARRLVVDAVRARSARPAEALAAELSSATTGDDVDAALNTAIVVDALRSLSAPHRAILIDYFYRGRTAAEIAAERGMPAGTARSRVYYAMRAMRLALQERGVEGP